MLQLILNKVAIGLQLYLTNIDSERTFSHAIKKASVCNKRTLTSALNKMIGMNEYLYKVYLLRLYFDALLGCKSKQSTFMLGKDSMILLETLTNNTGLTIISNPVLQLQSQNVPLTSTSWPRIQFKLKTRKKKMKHLI